MYEVLSLDFLVCCRQSWKVFRLWEHLSAGFADQTCCDIPLLFGNDSPMPGFRFCLWGGGGGEGLQVKNYIPVGSSSDWNVLSSVVVCDVSHPSIVLKFIGCVIIGEKSNSSNDWGLLFSSCQSAVGCSIAIVARILNGFSRRFSFFKLCGVIGTCRPNSNGIVRSFELESIATICGSGDATCDNIIISQVLLPNSSVELRTIRVLALGGLSSPDGCFTEITSKSLDSGEIGRNIFNSMLQKCS